MYKNSNETWINEYLKSLGIPIKLAAVCFIPLLIMCLILFQWNFNYICWINKMIYKILNYKKIIDWFFDINKMKNIDF